MRGRESVVVFVLLIVASTLAAAFEVIVLGRSMLDASLGFASGVVLAALIAGIMDCVGRDEGPRGGDDG